MKRKPYPARQRRSEITLQRILAATEELLEKRDFSQINVRDIARRARRAVGTVYTRVPDKDTLLAHLLDRFSERSAAGIAKLTNKGRAEGWGLERRVAETCKWVVDRYVEERGIVRSLAHALFFEAPAAAPSFRENMGRQTRELVAFLAEDATQVAHSDPPAACEFAVTSILAIAQNRIVFGDQSAIGPPVSRRKLVRNLTDVVVGYLVTRPRAA